MQKQLILNQILFNQNLQKQNKYLKEKILNAKPKVNSTCPKSFLSLKNKNLNNIICMYINH